MNQIIVLLLLVHLPAPFGWSYFERPLQMDVPNEKGIYEFILVVEHSLTMTTQGADAQTPIVDYSPQQRKWTQRDPDFRKKCTANETILDEDSELAQMDRELGTLLQWDGRHRKIVTINGKSPADPIVVPLGARVLLRVQNRLHTQSVSVHVHGMNMHGRWWSDGVPYVQQCPIAPASDYTYRFFADTPGTLWFHGHLMGDRSMGLLGGFVVMRPNERTEFLTESGMLPSGRQYYAILQDWNPESVEDAWLDQQHGRLKWLAHRMDSGDPNDCIQPENAGPPRTGAFFGFSRANTILVNEKGWHDQLQLRTIPSKLPIANFAVKRGENIVLRLVNGGAWEALYVWLEEHEFWVLAADGAYVKPKRVDSVLVHPGERYDLLVRGLQLPQRKVYRFVFETLLSYMANATSGQARKRYGLANLRYEDFGRRRRDASVSLAREQRDDTDIVDWTHQKCTERSPCTILNCPYAEFYSRPRNFSCISNDQLENAEPQAKKPDTELLAQKPKGKFHELMFNVYAGLNGWHFKMPQGIPHFQQNEMEKVAPPCDDKKCNRWEQVNKCFCFLHYEFGLGDIVQITVGTHANMPHPFHVHGTKFRVMKTGLMGTDYAQNREMKCPESDPYCLTLEWANSSYAGGNIPGMNKNPPLRDTVMVPNKGFVVIRFRALNPGWFFAHCHLLYHNMWGMAFSFKVDAATGPSQIAQPPGNFPRSCGTYDGLEPWEGPILAEGQQDWTDKNSLLQNRK